MAIKLNWFTDKNGWRNKLYEKWVWRLSTWLIFSTIGLAIIGGIFSGFIGEKDLNAMLLYIVGVNLGGSMGAIMTLGFVDKYEKKLAGSK